MLLATHFHERTLAIASASLLVIASTGFGAVYAWGVGSSHGPLLGCLTVALALGLEAAKPLAIDGTITALRTLAIGRAVALLALGLVAVSYSITAEISLLAALKGQRATEGTHKANAAQSLQDQQRRALEELGQLPASRLEGALAALQRALTATPKFAPCEDPSAPAFGPISRRVCGEIAALEAERATSRRKVELEALVRQLDDHLASLGAVPLSADPTASAVATYLSAIGLSVPIQALTDWLTLVPVIALEVGSALSLVLVRAVQPVPQVITEVSRGGVQSPEIARPALTSGAQKGTAKAALLSHVQANGGHVRVGVRGLAKALKVSPSRAHQVVGELATEGRLEVQATRSGTTLRLLSR